MGHYAMQPILSSHPFRQSAPLRAPMPTLNGLFIQNREAPGYVPREWCQEAHDVKNSP